MSWKVIWKGGKLFPKLWLELRLLWGKILRKPVKTGAVLSRVSLQALGWGCSCAHPAPPPCPPGSCQPGHPWFPHPPPAVWHGLCWLPVSSALMSVALWRLFSRDLVCLKMSGLSGRCSELNEQYFCRFMEYKGPRGQQSLQITLLLLCLKKFFPVSVLVTFIT